MTACSFLNGSTTPILLPPFVSFVLFVVLDSYLPCPISYIAVLAWIMGFARLWLERPRIAHTTLTHPWWWLVVALTGVCGVELLTNVVPPEMFPAVRYLARALLLCPVVSLLGAKRPQDGPWNFVVVALWIMLELPAFSHLVLARGEFFVPLPWCAMLAVGWFVSLLNGLSTRWQWSAIWIGTGQGLLLFDAMQPTWPHLVSEMTRPILVWMGIAHFGLAAICPATSAEPANSTDLDRLWFQCRDQLGLFWSLRYQQRLNETAEKLQWPIRLEWNGWQNLEGRPIDESLPPEIQRAARQTSRSLLRRFIRDVKT